MVHTYEDIIYTKQDGVSTVSINRPWVLNAFRPRTIDEMIEAFHDAWYDDSIGVVVLTGEQGNFCTGGDQKIRGHGGYEDESGTPRLQVRNLHRMIREIPKPVIAKVDGYAIGGGHVLHVICDLTLASERAIFGQTGPKVGSFDAGSTAAEVARGADVIITMVPDTPDVEQVLFGPAGVAEGLAPGKTVVDMSSISPIQTKVFASRYALGCDYLDAPVSGGQIGARNGALTIMVGGSEEVFARVKPIFDSMGKNITLSGQERRWPDLQGCQPDHRRPQHRGSGRSAALRVEGGRRPFEGAPGAPRGLRGVSGARGARRAHDQADVRAGVPGRAASEGSEPRPLRRASARRGTPQYRHGAGAVQHMQRDGGQQVRPLGHGTRPRAARRSRAGLKLASDLRGDTAVSRGAQPSPAQPGALRPKLQDIAQKHTFRPRVPSLGNGKAFASPPLPRSPAVNQRAHTSTHVC